MKSNLNLEELNSLINIRQYISNCIANAAIDRATVSVMSGMLILVDNKILAILQGDSFKEYVGYKDVRKAIQEVAKITNIKSGIKK